MARGDSNTLIVLRHHTEAWTPEEQQRADELQIEGGRLYRALKAALRREPSPRELHRARQVYFRDLGIGG